MAETNIPELLRKMMEAIPANQKALAKRLGGGVTQPDISRYLKGSVPEGPRYQRIIDVARQVGVLPDLRSEDVAASLDAPPDRRMVKLKGYVGAGGEAHYYAIADEDFEEVEAPAGATDRTVAVEIRGKSLGPLMDSWLVFYHDVRSPITDDLIGELCVVGLADDRILVKQIQRDGRGGYRLISNSNEPPIENAVIEWAARVTDLRPRR